MYYYYYIYNILHWMCLLVLHHGDVLLEQMLRTKNIHQHYQYQCMLKAKSQTQYSKSSFVSKKCDWKL